MLQSTEFVHRCCEANTEMEHLHSRLDFDVSLVKQMTRQDSTSPPKEYKHVFSSAELINAAR